MNAAETIAAAIEHLEAVRTAPVPSAVQSEVISWARRDLGSARAANYIVRITSERGVDAQLAILQLGMEKAYPFPATFPASSVEHVALHLARAILGDES